MHATFHQNIKHLMGEAGQKWLDELPNTIRKYETQWHIQCSPPFTLSYNYVAPARTQDGKSVVLKLSFPNNSEFISEISALHFFNGVGSVRVIRESENKDALLLERAVPGKRIGDLAPDRKQISTVAKVLRLIHKPVSDAGRSHFLTLSDWSKAFSLYRKKYLLASGPVPRNFFEKAEYIFSQSIPGSQGHILLHGDLHNDNIVSSERGWLVIDPKGVTGEREFDVGTYLRNPYTDITSSTNLLKVETDRIMQFADELSLDRQSILDWTLANAVLSLLWSLEDSGKISELYLQNLELINRIRV